MSERDVYIQRLTEIGYRQTDAIKIVDMYYVNQNLDGLEDYITAKASLAEVG